MQIVWMIVKGVVASATTKVITDCIIRAAPEMISTKDIVWRAIGLFGVSMLIGGAVDKVMDDDLDEVMNIISIAKGEKGE